jgi:hypothetical protein
MVEDLYNNESHGSGAANEDEEDERRKAAWKYR